MLADSTRCLVPISILVVTQHTFEVAVALEEHMNAAMKSLEISSCPMCNAIAMKTRTDTSRGVPACDSVLTACLTTYRARTADASRRKHQLADQMLGPSRNTERLASVPMFNCFTKSNSRWVPAAPWYGSNHDPSSSANSSLRNSVSGSASIGTSKIGSAIGTS